MAHIYVVNTHNEVIGTKERTALQHPDISRVSALWIQNSAGDVLLAQRASNKKYDPSKWGPAVSGTVEVGETYESNIIKEAGEEIGLTGVSFQPFGHPILVQQCVVIQWYRVTLDRAHSSFVIQTQEVAQIKWFHKEELLALLDDSPHMFSLTSDDWKRLFLT